MLYLLEDGEHYKVGYSENEETLLKRIASYKTHNATFKYLGLRNGTKKDEKYYHKLLNCEKKSEWSCNVDKDVLESIKLDFILESYLPSLFRKNIEPYEGEIIEPYSTVHVLLNDVIHTEDTIIMYVILCSNGIFVYSTKNRKKYKVIGDDLQIQTFYYNYDEYGEKYVGFIIEDIIFYDYQKSRTPYNMFGYFCNKEQGYYLLEKFKPILKPFSILK